MPPSTNALLRLQKHADYQRVYAGCRKHHAGQMSFFFSLRPAERRSRTSGPRIGLTVGKVLGNAVERNRIKRRLRECVRRHQALLTQPVDVILHPRRAVLTLSHTALDREVESVLRSVAAMLRKQAASTPARKASA